MSKFGRYFEGARQYLYDNPYERRGQAYMNFLRTGFDRDAFDAIHGSDLDPWDREERFHIFLAALLERWRS